MEKKSESELAAIAAFYRGYAAELRRLGDLDRAAAVKTEAEGSLTVVQRYLRDLFTMPRYEPRFLPLPRLDNAPARRKRAKIAGKVSQKAGILDAIEQNERVLKPLGRNAAARYLHEKFGFGEVHARGILTGLKKAEAAHKAAGSGQIIRLPSPPVRR